MVCTSTHLLREPVSFLIFIKRVHLISYFSESMGHIQLNSLLFDSFEQWLTQLVSFSLNSYSFWFYGPEDVKTLVYKGQLCLTFSQALWVGFNWGFLYFVCINNGYRKSYRFFLTRTFEDFMGPIVKKHSKTHDFWVFFDYWTHKILKNTS